MIDHELKRIAYKPNAEAVLAGLRDLGNSVLVVEHDADTLVMKVSRGPDGPLLRRHQHLGMSRPRSTSNFSWRSRARWPA